MINIQQFISTHITNREQSMLLQDMLDNDHLLRERIGDRSVLVIGGAGTIGSSFIKALLPYKPASLIVVDINENGLTELTRDLRSSSSYSLPVNYITYPMSYADPAFSKMFRHWEGFDIVANFSAHKHVRSEKDVFSVEVLLKNNVIMAKGLLDLLTEYPPRHFFCVSTDKAANPVNIMGASKKLMEEMIMSYAHLFPVTTARFANVAFSNGSLLAGFLERLQKQQPISAPLDVKRYFVSPEESGQICLLACVLGNSAEIFFPKLEVEQMMGFEEIARALLKELKYDILECSSEQEAKNHTLQLRKGGKGWPVYFSGSNTTGEKAYEEFYTQDEKIDSDRFRALGVVAVDNIKPMAEVDAFLENLKELFEKEQTRKEDIVASLQEFLPNFAHEEKGKFLDGKM